MQLFAVSLHSLFVFSMRPASNSCAKLAVCAISVSRIARGPDEWCVKIFHILFCVVPPRRLVCIPAFASAGATMENKALGGGSMDSHEQCCFSPPVWWASEGCTCAPCRWPPREENERPRGMAGKGNERKKEWSAEARAFNACWPRPADQMLPIEIWILT